MYSGMVKIVKMNVFDYMKWIIRSQAPTSVIYKDMEKVQRLDEIGLEGASNPR